MRLCLVGGGGELALDLLWGGGGVSGDSVT
jgi:hypothetical protein